MRELTWNPGKGTLSDGRLISHMLQAEAIVLGELMHARGRFLGAREIADRVLRHPTEVLRSIEILRSLLLPFGCFIVSHPNFRLQYRLIEDKFCAVSLKPPPKSAGADRPAPTTSPTGDEPAMTAVPVLLSQS